MASPHAGGVAAFLPVLSFLVGCKFFMELASAVRGLGHSLFARRTPFCIALGRLRPSLSAKWRFLSSCGSYRTVKCNHCLMLSSAKVLLVKTLPSKRRSQSMRKTLTFASSLFLLGLHRHRSHEKPLPSWVGARRTIRCCGPAQTQPRVVTDPPPWISWIEQVKKWKHHSALRKTGCKARITRPGLIFSPWSRPKKAPPRWRRILWLG